jgi:hypothetical protein
MSRWLKYAATALLFGFTGCGADPFLIQPFISGLVQAQCQNVAGTAVLPDGVPANLAVVQADPAGFSPATNPLAGVVVGTKLDDLAGLAGCWGRYTRQTFDSSQTGQNAASEEFAVLQFDLDGGTVTLHRYFTLPSADPDSSLGRVNQLLGGIILSDLPIFMTEVYTITSMSDNLLVLQGVSAEAAAVGEDGRPVFNCLAALSAEVNAQATLRMLLTRQGQFLKEYDESVESDGTSSAPDIVPAEVDEFADLWARFDCSAS